jgi:hypothetical protein
MSLNNEEKANIKCPSCKSYRYPSDFLNDKNRTLKTCKNCRKNAKKMRDKNAIKSSDKDIDEISQVLKDITPLCDDVIGLIMDFTTPSKFEVGSVYSSVRCFDIYIADNNFYDTKSYEVIYHHKVIKRTKCFIYVDIVGTNPPINMNAIRNKKLRLKICKDNLGNECLNSCYSINSTNIIA